MKLLIFCPLLYITYSYGSLEKGILVSSIEILQEELNFIAPGVSDVIGVIVFAWFVCVCYHMVTLLETEVWI